MIEYPKVTRFAERLDFIRTEFRRAGRRADDGAARALLDAVGSDLRELAAACDQLAADTDGLIDESVVARYYRGRAEATGFTVADRAVEGHLAQALEQLRWALATGVSPVLICSALAQGVRLLGRVGSAPRGASSAALAAEVGAPPWKIDRVRQQLRGWHPNGIARALHAVAEADAQVKGEATSAAYALERAVRRIVASRAGDDPRLSSRPAGDDLAGLEFGVALGDRGLAVRGLVLVDDALAGRLVELPGSGAQRGPGLVEVRRRRRPRGTCARRSAATTSTALLRWCAFSFCLLRLIWDLMFATRGSPSRLSVGDATTGDAPTKLIRVRPPAQTRARSRARCRPLPGPIEAGRQGH